MFVKVSTTPAMLLAIILQLFDLVLEANQRVSVPGHGGRRQMPREVPQTGAAHQLDILVLAEDVRHRAQPGRLAMIALASPVLVGRQVDILGNRGEQVTLVRGSEGAEDLPARNPGLLAGHLDLGQPVPDLGARVLHGPHVLEGSDRLQRGGGNHDPVLLGQLRYPEIVLGHQALQPG